MLIGFVGWSAKKYGIPLTLDDSKSKGIKTHSWLVQHGYSNIDHIDPWQYLPKIGVSRAQFAYDLTKGFSGTNIALTR